MKVEQHKVFQVIKCLSKREKKRLRDFLASPFFNKREDVLCLYDYLCVPRRIAIVPEQLFETIYSERTFKPQDLRLLQSYLFKLVECFLIYEHRSQPSNEASNRIAAIESYQKLKLPKLAQQNIRIYEKIIENDPRRDADYHFQVFRLHNTRYDFSSGTRPSARQPIEEMSDSLDTAYFCLKLQQACHAQSNKSTYGHQYDLKMLPEILYYIEMHQLQEELAIGLYYYIYRAFTAPDPQQALQRLKTYLPKIPNSFPYKECRDIYLMLLNHCIRGINRGETLYLHEAFDLYKEGIKSDSLLENGVLSRFTYSNIVRIAIKVGELNWAEDFIEQYRGVIEKRSRESTYSYNCAELAYTRKDYKRALHYLHDFDYKNAVLVLGAKNIILKIYYEQGEWESLGSHLQAMSGYIRRQKDLGNYRINYDNIIRYTKHICRLKENSSTESEQAALRRAIESEEILTEREWLLARLDMR